MADTVQIDVEPFALEDGDVVLVCCDGLTGKLEVERIASTIEREAAQEGLSGEPADGSGTQAS